MEELTTGYELSRNFFDWCFENPEKVKPNHIAMYFFIVEHWNRLGQKDKFGLPMEMTKDAIGIKNYKTYSKTFEDLVEWRFIKVLERSRNQYSANVIALVKNTKANTKALSKASLKHSQKHSQKQVQSIVGIDKPITIEPITYTINIDFEIFWNEYDKKVGNKEKLKTKWEKLTDKERQDAIWYIPMYKQCQPDKQYRKNPETFLNNKSWNDEIIHSNGQTFKTNAGTKLTGTQKAAEKFAGEVAEKSKRFAENMQNT